MGGEKNKNIRKQNLTPSLSIKLKQFSISETNLYYNWSSELSTAKASWLPVSSSLPGCRSSSGSYMLSTGVTSRDTHGSLFQDLDGRMSFWTALQKQTFSNRCTFAANMLRAAILCPLPTEKRIPALGSRNGLFIILHSSGPCSWYATQE